MAEPRQDLPQAIDVGNGVAATVYDDGSVVFWNITTGEATGKVARLGDQAADIGNGYAVAIDANGTFSPPWNINEDAARQGQPAGQPAGGTGPGISGPTPTSTAGPTPPGGSGKPGAPAEGTYYKGTYGGQTQRGSVPFGQTVAPGTWNPENRAQGRGEGWGSIGAGTVGQEYGYGTSWNRPGERIKIDEKDLKYLSDARPTVAQGYIPGSATYNQYDLSKGGLFAEMKGPGGATEVVNTRFGLGGTGDPTTGGEYQTPEKYITGNASASGVSQKGDARWRAEGRGGGGVSRLIDTEGLIRVRPEDMEVVQPGDRGGSGGTAGYGTGGGAPGTGGGESSFFGSTVTSNWGQTAETAGKDYIATLFLRSDTPTGIGTPAYSAPAAMWQGLADEIKAGRVYVKNPMAWQMLQEKGYTPQNIGGAATGGQNVQPNGQAGTGTGTGTKPSDQFGVSGTFQEGESTPFGNIKGGLPGGFGYEWNKLLVEKGLEERDLSLKEKQQLFDEAYKNTQLAQAQQKIDAEIKNLADQIAVKREEIASIAATGDKDREQRERENLRLMEQQAKELEQRKGEALGMIDGKQTLDAQKALGVINGENTLEMQKFLADQQQQAYERAADPARAFENELARGATGWNAPMQGPWGTTTGIPSEQLALGQGAATQAQGMPNYNYGQPINFGQPGNVTGQPLPGQPQPALPAGAGAPEPAMAQQAGQAPQMTEQMMQQAAQAKAQQAAMLAGMTQEQRDAYFQQQAGQMQLLGGPEVYDQAAMAQAQAGYQNGYQAAQAGTTPQDQTGGVQGQQQTGGFQGSAVPGYGAPAPNWGYGSQGAAGLGQPDLNQQTVRTPAAVNAFKAGAAAPTAGQYGVQSTAETAQNAAINERQVRTQNLKQSRRMSPVARAVVGSFAKAGGVDEGTQKFYGDRSTPKASGSAGSYAMR